MLGFLVLLFDTDLHFQGTTFGILSVLRIFRKWSEIEQILLLLSYIKSDICHPMAPL